MREEWEFEWDPTKAELNRRKHGITFEVAEDIWDDPFYLEFPLAGGPEQRFGVVGRLDFGYLTAIITYRGERTIRIISARMSGKKEVEAYEGD